MKFLPGRPLFSAIYECKKGVEIGLPICVLCHLDKSNKPYIQGRINAYEELLEA